MELVLLQKVKNLGDLGDKVNVKPGYGRNFLVPQGKAVPATATNVAEFEKRRAEYEAKANSILGGAETRKAALEGATITVKANASPEGKLFGSVGPRDIAEAFSATGHAAREERSGHGRRPDPPHGRVRHPRAPARGRPHDRQGRSWSAPKISDPRNIADRRQTGAAKAPVLFSRSPASRESRRHERSADFDPLSLHMLAQLCTGLSRAGPVIPAQARLIHRMFSRLSYRGFAERALVSTGPVLDENSADVGRHRA